MISILVLTVFFLGHVFPVAQPTTAREVSLLPNTLTQYTMNTPEYPVTNIGLLAHDWAAGAYIAELQPGDQIILNSSNVFVVTGVYEFRNISNWLTFLDLETGEYFNHAEIFSRFYQSGGLTLQTCIPGGVMFVQAEDIRVMKFVVK
jgi:hypothetical protein